MPSNFNPICNSEDFSQVKCIDYIKTFAPISKMNYIHLVLSLDASYKWEVHQMDIKPIFLHGDLCEEICMERPLGSSKITLAMYVSLSNLFMALSKPLDLGMPKWTSFF